MDNKIPIPERNELERRFTKVLNSMDLPPDKARVLRQYDDDKKWDLICDQEKMAAKDPPSVYLEKLSAFMDPKSNKSLKKRKHPPCPTSTQVLRDLEISLRTNNIEWVREFLNEQNGGLDILIQYLGLANTELQRTLGTQQNLSNGNAHAQNGFTPSAGGRVRSTNSSPKHGTVPSKSNGQVENGGDYGGTIPKRYHNNSSYHHLQGCGSSSSNSSGSNNSSHPPPGQATGNTSTTTATSYVSSLFHSLAGLASSGNSAYSGAPSSTLNSASQISCCDDPSNDVHLCIMSLRALMNNKYGFNQVISHKTAINYIALSLTHKNYRTKAQVLELLAAVCLVKGGHDIILSAFEYFKEVMREGNCFETLMHYFKHYEDFNIDFMVACMQFINIVVHSVENMNYRVALQHAFTKIGLDEYLEKLRHTESEQLQVQISAYLDNVCDVGGLMEEAELKNSALEQVADLQEQIENLNEKLVETENQAMARIVEMQTYLEAVNREKEEIKKMYEAADFEACTLKRNFSAKESDFIQKQQELDHIMKEYIYLKDHFAANTNLSASSTACTGGPMASVGAKLYNSNEMPPPPPLQHLPPPPPPPPPSLSRGSGGPHHPPHAPNIPPLGSSKFQNTGPGGAESMTIKRRVETKYRLPMLNWIPLKPRQLKGTIFNDLEDEALLKVIDFNSFEETFKLGNQRNELGAGPIGADGSGHGNSNSVIDAIMNRKAKDLNTVLEASRIRNLAITRRRLDMEDAEIMRAINNLDLKLLDLETVDILLRMLPTENERKAYRTYESEGKHISSLTPEDRFLHQLCKVERLNQKLSIMSFMGNFAETVHLVTPQIHALIVASKSIRSSEKLKKIFEIILSFGNYLNSNRKGGVYGFKIQSLDSLTILKAPSNKDVSLLHFVVKTIKEKFPALLNFDSDLTYTEKAADASLENIVTDVHELSKGMEDFLREYHLRKTSPQSPTNAKETMAMMEDFIKMSQDKLSKLKTEAKAAEEAYCEVVEYFGESAKALPPNAFFPLFVRFVRQFKQAHFDNEQRLEAKKVKTPDHNSPNKNVQNNLNGRPKTRRQNEQGNGQPPGGNSMMVHELKRRQNSSNCNSSSSNNNGHLMSSSNSAFIKDALASMDFLNSSSCSAANKKQLLSQDQVYHGALEDILTDLKKEPYRAADVFQRKSGINVAR